MMASRPLRSILEWTGWRQVWWAATTSARRRPWPTTMRRWRRPSPTASFLRRRCPKRRRRRRRPRRRRKRRRRPNPRPACATRRPSKWPSMRRSTSSVASGSCSTFWRRCRGCASTPARPVWGRSRPRSASPRPCGVRPTCWPCATGCAWNRGRRRSTTSAHVRRTLVLPPPAPAAKKPATNRRRSLKPPSPTLNPSISSNQSTWNTCPSWNRLWWAWKASSSRTNFLKRYIVFDIKAHCILQQ